MSFRGRLRVFFAIIVIVPMIAVAVVLFGLSKQSETGKADAGIATALRNAVKVYGDASALAKPSLGRIASDPALDATIAAGDTGRARARMAALRAADPRLETIELYDGQGRLLARAGPRTVVALRAAPLLKGGHRTASLAVSVT